MMLQSHAALDKGPADADWCQGKCSPIVIKGVFGDLWGLWDLQHTKRKDAALRIRGPV